MPPKQMRLTSFFGPATSFSSKADRPEARSSVARELVVGQRIKLWRVRDGAWYEGVVVSYVKEACKHQVLYDDGETEVLDLSKEKYQLQGSQMVVAIEQANQAEQNRQATLEKRRASAARRVIVIEEYEENIAPGVSEKPANRAFPAAMMAATASKRQREASAAMPVEATKKPKAGLPALVGGESATFERAFAYPGDEATQATDAEAQAQVLAEAYAVRQQLEVRCEDVEEEALVHDIGSQAGKKVGVFPAGAHAHDTREKYWCLTKRRVDSAGRRPDEPDFDRRTMRLPRDFSEKSPVASQWWELKTRYCDCILFFKIGRFYELYHTDADIGVSEAGLVYMKGEQAHAGFPEPAYSKYLEVLVSRGYKVARVEQTETPEAQKRRVELLRASLPRGRKLSDADKSMRREVCSLVTPGTRCYTYLEQDSTADAADDDAVRGRHSLGPPTPSVGPDAAPRWLAAVSERNGRVGLCFLDAARAVFILAEFDEDRTTWTRLRTALCEYPPVEVLLERGAGDPDAVEVVRSVAASSLDVAKNLEFLAPGCEFWDAARTVDEIASCLPKVSKEQARSVAPSHPGVDPYSRWPPVLGAAVAGGADRCVSALGAVAFWLRRGLIDVELLSMANFNAYAPPDLEPGTDLVPLADADRLHAADALLCLDEGRLVLAAAELKRAVRGADEDDEDADEGLQAQDAALVRAARGHDRAARRMSLDANTLDHLEVLETKHRDGKTGSLWWLFASHLRTAMGRRLLRQWLARPLFEPHDVRARTDAVAELVARPQLAEALSKALRKVPDLERLFQQLHTLGSARRAPKRLDNNMDDMAQHPDARAILFDALKLNRRKVQQLVDALRGLRACETVIHLAADDTAHHQNDDDASVFNRRDDDGITAAPCSTFRSLLLRRCIERLDETAVWDRGHVHPGCFPVLGTHLDKFERGFDLDAAQRTGVLEARRGSDDAYDAACDERDALLKDLNAWLTATRRSTRTQELQFVATARDRFNVKVPEECFGCGLVFENLPVGWVQKNKAKKHRTFEVPEVRAKVKALESAERRVNEAKLDQLRSLFAAFDCHRYRWAAAVACVATLDALLALAKASRRDDFCRAVYLDDTPDAPRLVLRDSAHPCLNGDTVGLFTGHTEIIRNDLNLGLADGDTEGDATGTLLLLSGPNMGGKSTLLRQVCCNAILAQVGAFVRAASCELTPVDRIFTRLGASDRIFRDQSTFMVELLETAQILNHATRQSLCILDELGRGTATADGVAITHAVVRDLVLHVRCRALFSTHYHDLLYQWKDRPGVQLGHMDCLVETDDPDPVKHDITFLYKLVPGIAPKSFGINVARLAKIPDSIIQVAIHKAAAFQDRLDANKAANNAHIALHDTEEAMPEQLNPNLICTIQHLEDFMELQDDYP